MLTTYEEELARGGTVFFTGTGVSMKPLIRPGRDVICVEALGDRSPRRYEAVLFLRPGTDGKNAYVLHRILKCRKDGSFWIVGDNCTAGDVVPRHAILGAVTAVNRAGKLLRVTDLSYRLYLLFWCKPYRLRFAFLRLYRKAAAALYRLKHGKDRA